MAGIVEKGGTFLGDDYSTTTSLGQDDIFVVQVNSAKDIVWLKHMGTSGNDRLAHGSTGLVVNGESNQGFAKNAQG